MRRTFAALATLLTLAVVAQFFLAASGSFGDAPDDESFRPHRLLGMVILLFAVLLTIVGALARMPGRLIGLAGLVAGLTVVQIVLRVIAEAFGDAGGGTSTAGSLVFGLHAVNGLAIMAASGIAARQARELSRSGPPDRPGSADAAGTPGSVAGSAAGSPPAAERPSR